MSKRQAERFIKQLSAFIQNNSQSSPDVWIGTITYCSELLDTCNVKFKGKGELQEIPTFGVPKEGTTAIVFFINGSYSNPIALCDPMNVLCQDRVDTIKGSGAQNWHDNGDFTRDNLTYSGTFKVDNSITSGHIDVTMNYVDSNNTLYTITNKTNSEIRTWNNGLKLTLDISSLTSTGVININGTITKNGQPIKNKPVTINIYGEIIHVFTSNEGKIFHKYIPKQPFTGQGYMAVLPQKGNYIEFTCEIPQKDNEYFKVQTYFQSTESVLQLEVKNKQTGKYVKNVPYALGKEKNTWKIKTSKWLVNRATYPKEGLEQVIIRFTNIGDNPIRLDGILVHDENSDYDYYKSREDLINA